MKPFLVLYATREGQTRKIAEHVGAKLREHGLEVDVLDAATLPKDFDLARYGGAILGASVHYGKHESEMIEFAKSHRAELERMRAAFLSVSGAEGGAEDLSAPPEARERSARTVREMIDAFIKETGWTPAHVFPVGGALMYLEYNPLIRLMIRVIARLSKTPLDTSRNTEYTDWNALDRSMDQWAIDTGDIEPARSGPEGLHSVVGR